MPGDQQGLTPVPVSQAELERQALLQHGEQIEKYEGKRPYQMGATNLGAAGQKTPRSASRVPKLTLVDATPRTPRRSSMPTTPNRTSRPSLLDAIPPTPGTVRRQTPRGSTPGSSTRRSSGSGSNLDDWMLRMRGCPLVKNFDISKGVQQQNMKHLVDRIKWEGNALDDDIQATLLGMYGKTMNIEACRAVATMISFNTTLTSLNLSDAEINDAGVAHLARCLSTNGNIAKVKLQGNRIGAKGGAAIASALVENQAITVLDLHGNPIGPQGARAIGEALLVNGTVTDLNLRLCKILDDGCRKVAEALKGNRALTAVNLTGNEIGDGGGWALADALRKNRCLTSLTVCSNHIGGDAAPALADSLRGHPSLRTFNLIPLGLLSDGLLKKLDCSYRQCGSPGVQVVSQLLRTSRSLLEVDLRDNGLNDLDVRSLMTAVWESDALREDDPEEWPPLQSLDLVGNYEQKVIPRDVVDQGGEAVVELLRKMQRGTEEGEEVRLKWAFIGRGECGKTSFSRSLMKGSELAGESTIGLEITDGYKPFSKPPLLVSMWDFGGHGTYWRGSNQHFLTERRTLYLLCFDISYQRPDLLIPTDGKEAKAPWGEEEEMQWLRFFTRILLTHVPRAVVTLVGLKADLVEDAEERARRLALAAEVFNEVVEAHRQQLEEHLDALRHTPGKGSEVGMTYQHMTEAQLQQQIQLLEDRIKYRMRLAGEPIAVANTDKESPRQIIAMAERFIKDTRLFPDFRNIHSVKWRSLVKAVEASKADTSEDGPPKYRKWDDFVEFAMSLEENAYTSEEEVEPAAELMHEVGLILYYKRDPVLRNLVVMDPEWLVESIFRYLVRHDYSHLSIVDSEMKRRLELMRSTGVLDALLLESLWEEHDRSLYHDLFRLMVKFEVVMPYSRRTALFPLCLPAEPDLEVKRTWRSSIKPQQEAVTGACIDICPTPSGFFERMLCQIWPLVQLQKAWRRERSPGMPYEVDAGALATSRRTSATLLLEMQGEILVVMARAPKPEEGPSKELLLELAADVRAVVDYARKLLAVGYHGAIFEMHALCPHCLIQNKGVALEAPEVAEGILMLSKDSSVVECPRCDLELPPRGRVYETLSGQADTPERLISYELFLSFRAARNRNICVDVQDELKETLMTPYWDQGNNSVESGSAEQIEAAQGTIMRAMVESYLYMPVLCRGTLVDMERMTEQSEDTVLLEYILASELQRSGSTQVMMPLLVGPNFPEEITRGIKDAASHKVPSIVPQRLFDKVAKMLEAVGIETEPVRRPVRKLVEEMLAAPCIVLSHQKDRPVASHVRAAVEKIETTVKEVRMSRLAGGVIVGDTSEQEYLSKRVGAVTIELDVKVDMRLSQSMRRRTSTVRRRSPSPGKAPKAPEAETSDERYGLWPANASTETVMGFGIEVRPSPAGAFEALIREMQKSGCFATVDHKYGPLKGGLPGEVDALAVFEVLRSHATLLLRMDGNAVTVIARAKLRDRSDLEVAVALRAAVNIVEDAIVHSKAMYSPVNMDDFVLCPKCLGNGASGFGGENREDVLEMHKGYDDLVDSVGAWDLYRFHQSLKVGTVIECLACHRKLMSSPALDVLDLDTPINFSAGSTDVVIHYQNPPPLPKSEGPDRRPMYQDLVVEMGEAVEEDVRVFVDSRPDGTSMSAEYEEEVAEAIGGCSVFLTVINDAVLNAAVDRDDYDILAPSILALELLEAGRIQAVVPVFVDGEPPKKLPPASATVPDAVYKRIEGILTKLGVTSDTVFPEREVPRRRSAREVAQGLLRCQGLKCPPMTASASLKSEPFERFFRLLATHSAGFALNGLRLSAEWQVRNHKEMMVARYHEAEAKMAGKAAREGSPSPQRRRGGSPAPPQKRS